MLLKYKWVHLVSVLLLALLAIKAGDLYNYAAVKDVLSTLQNISAMIFTIAGIWLAYIYPKAISAIVKPSTFSKGNRSESEDSEIVFESPEVKLTPEEKSSIDKDINRISMIVETILTSAFVILVIIHINVFKPLIANIDVIKENITVMNKLGCFISLTLVYLQVISLLTITTSNVIFLNDIHNEKNKKELNNLR